MAKHINRVSQANMLVKSQVIKDEGLIDVVEKVRALMRTTGGNEKYSMDLKVTEEEAQKLQDLTAEAVKEWEWQAYELTKSINYKGVEAEFTTARMLPNIIDYGAPIEECGLCHHAIRYGYTLSNKRNGNKLIVGSECIHSYSVNVIGGDLGQEAADVVKAAQRRMEKEIKIQAFNQNFPNVTQDIERFKKELFQMPINVAEVLYEVRSAYWVDRKRDMQRLARLETGIAKNAMLNKKQINVYEDIKELIDVELPAAIKKYEEKTGRKVNPTPTDKSLEKEEVQKQQETFDKIFSDFHEYGYSSKWITGVYESFQSKQKPLSPKQKTIINDQYKNFLTLRASKQAKQEEAKEQGTTVKELTLQAVKEKKDSLITIPKWLAKSNNITSLAMEGYIDKETAKGVYVIAHASVEAAVVCSVCGKGLTNELSRVLAIGPICASKYGIERPNKLDLEDPQVVKEMTEKIESHVFEGWLPKSWVTVEPLDEALRRAQQARSQEVEEEEEQDTLEF